MWHLILVSQIICGYNCGHIRQPEDEKVIATYQTQEFCLGKAMLMRPDNLEPKGDYVVGYKLECRSTKQSIRGGQ